jgi:hypothetical protein
MDQLVEADHDGSQADYTLIFELGELTGAVHQSLSCSIRDKTLKMTHSADAEDTF